MVVTGHVAGDPRRLAIDLPDLQLEPVLRELEAVRAECVRLQHLGTRLRVRSVNVAHQVGCLDVQLIVALVDEHALGVQHRSHGAVEHDDALGIQ